MKKYLKYFVFISFFIKLISTNVIAANDRPPNSVFNCFEEKSNKINHQLIIDDFKKTTEVWVITKNYKWYAYDLRLVSLCYEKIGKQNDYYKLLDEAVTNILNFENIKNYSLPDEEFQEFKDDLNLIVNNYAVFELIYNDKKNYINFPADYDEWNKLKNVLYLNQFLGRNDNIYTYSKKIVFSSIQDQRILDEYIKFLDQSLSNTPKNSTKYNKKIFLEITKLKFLNFYNKNECLNFSKKIKAEDVNYKKLKLSNDKDQNEIHNIQDLISVYRDYFTTNTVCAGGDMETYLTHGKNLLDFFYYAKNNWSDDTDSFELDYLGWHAEMIYQYYISNKFTESKELKEKFFTEFDKDKSSLSEISKTSLLIKYYSKIFDMEKNLKISDLDLIYKTFEKINFENWIKAYSLVGTIERFEIERKKTLALLYELEAKILYNTGRLSEAIETNYKLKKILKTIVESDLYDLPNKYDIDESKKFLNTYANLIIYIRAANDLDKLLPVIKESDFYCEKAIKENAISAITCADIISNISPVLSYFSKDQISLEQREKYYKNFNSIFNSRFSIIRNIQETPQGFDIVIRKEFLKTNSILLNSIRDLDVNYTIKKDNSVVSATDLMCDFNGQQFQLANEFKSYFSLTETLGAALSYAGCLSLKNQKTEDFENQIINYLEDFNKNYTNDYKVSIASYLNYKNVDQTLIVALAINTLIEDSFNKENKKKMYKIMKNLFEVLHTQYGLSNYAAKKNYILKNLDSNDKLKFLSLLDLNKNKYNLEKELLNSSNQINNDLVNRRSILQNKINTLSQDLEKKLPQTKFIKIDNVQKKLKDDEAIITINWTTGFFVSSVITKDDFVLKNANFPELKKFMFQLRNKISNSPSKINFNEELEFSGKNILKKSLDVLKNKKINKLFLIVDENTANFPFESMIINDDLSNKYLIEIFSVSYFPSLQNFLNKKDSDIIISSADSYLGIGDPKFGNKKKDVDVNISLTRGGYNNDPLLISQKYSELPFTKKEIEQVSSLFKNNLKLLGQDANEKDTKINLSKNYNIIQFATHAEVVGEFENFNEPYLVLTPPNKADNSDDGLLTISEINDININAQLVILSACNTATKINEFANGFDGILSAFIDAGANSVIATHWPVEDNASYLIITKTLEKMINKKINLSEALKLTKIEFINGVYGSDYTHPFYWAPFIILK